MLKSKLSVLFLVAGLGLGHTVGAQQTCEDCQTGSGRGFGYPAAAGSGPIHGWGKPAPSCKTRYAAWKEEADLSCRRNEAWPKPFACLDRIAYHSIFDPMIQAGYEAHCILGDQHFDPQTQQLNSFGQSTLAGIMQNMPAQRKQIFVAQAPDEGVTEVRMENVSQLISTFYGQLAPTALVAASSLQPAMASGARAEGVLRKFTESAPAPIVPLQTSGTSIERSQRR